MKVDSFLGKNQQFSNPENKKKVLFRESYISDKIINSNVSVDKQIL